METAQGHKPKNKALLRAAPQLKPNCEKKKKNASLHLQLSTHDPLTGYQLQLLLRRAAIIYGEMRVKVLYIKNK